MVLLPLSGFTIQTNRNSPVSVEYGQEWIESKWLKELERDFPVLWTTSPKLPTTSAPWVFALGGFGILRVYLSQLECGF